MAIDINLGLSAVAGGTANLITATYSPAPTLVDKKILFLRSALANTGVVVFEPNSLGQKAVVKGDGSSLVAYDIPSADYVMILMFDLANDRWVYLNPYEANGKLLGTTATNYGFDSSSTIREALDAIDNGANNFLNKGLTSGRIFVGDASNEAVESALTLNATGGSFALSNIGVLTFPNAATGTRGLLTSADWNTFNGKQDALVSTTNIKSINGSSILGAGDLSVSASLVVATTTITSGTNTRILYNNSGVVGEYTLTGTGTVVAMQTSPTFVTDITTPKVIGGTSASGTLSLTSTSDATKGKINFGTLSAYDEVNDRLGLGTTSPSAELHLISTTEQLRVGYDVSNYWNATTNSAGLTTISAVGGTTNFLFNKNVQFGVGSAGASGLAVDIHEGTARWAIGKQVGSSNEIVLYGRVTPAASNYALLAGATVTLVNSPSSYVGFSVGGAVGATVYGTSMGVNIGGTAPTAKMHIRGTVEQLRLDYDVSNYLSTTVGSTGTVTFNAVGSGSKFVFSDNIELTQTVTTETVVSDRTVTIVINGTSYKLLAKS
jgi:hypothetical protein